MFKLQGIGGFLILISVLVGLWFGVVSQAIDAQANNATNYIQK